MYGLDWQVVFILYALWAIRSDKFERWKRRRKKNPEELVEVKKNLSDLPLYNDLPTWVSNFYMGSDDYNLYTLHMS